MQYYDKAGSWSITINARDLAGQPAIGPVASFLYNELRAIVITSPVGALNWPTLNQGAPNVLSNNHPNVIENTGNYEGPILITAYDLIGQTNPSYSIPASSFSAGPTSGLECTATQLQNSISTSITGTNIPRGVGAIEEIYYCIPSVPFVSSQSYSATGASSWIIGI